MERLTRTVIRYPRVALVVSVLVTIAFAFFLPRITMRTDLRSFVPEDDPVISEFEEAVSDFGSQDMMMVAVRGPIFTPGTLAKIQRLSEAIRDLPGVEKVTSPLDVNLVRGSELGIEILPVAPSLPQSPEEIESFRTNLFKTKQGASLVASDGRTAAIMVILEPGMTASHRASELGRKIEAIVEKERGPEEIYTVGEGYSSYYANKSMAQDLRALFPLAILTVIFILYLSFRSLSHVGIILLSVIMSIIWTMGFMAIAGYHLTIVSVVLPVILVAMGSAAGIHIINRFEEHRRNNPSLPCTQAVYQVMTALNSPILMTALTTAVGFFSLVTSFIVPVREFGIFSGAGILFSMVISLTFIPAYLSIKGSRNLKPINASPRKSSILGRFLEWSAHFATTKPQSVVIVAAVILVIFVAGIPKITVETNFLKYFREDSPVVRGTKLVEEDFGGTSRLSVVVDTGRPDGVKEPGLLRKLVELEKKMNSVDKVSNATSVADLVMEINRAFHGDDEAYYSIPDTREAIAQELLLFTMQGGSGLDSLVSYDFQKALVSAQVANESTAVLSQIVDRLAFLARETFKGTNIKTVVVGIPKVAVRLMERFIRSQLESLFWAMLGVWVVVAVIMFSAFQGALCLVPLVVTVVINFGFMGYTGADLDVTTTMIASICIGIGIDYAIHLISRYRQELLSGKTKQEAIAISVTSTGRGIFYNALTLILGFGILIFSRFRATSIFGSLLAGTMLTSSLGALVILPAVLQLIKVDYFVRAGRKIKNLPIESVRSVT